MMDSRVSDLANLFGADCVVLFMHQLVSHQPKAPIDNPGVCLVMFEVFEGVMNPQSSHFICVFSKKHHFHFSGSLTLCEKMYDVKLVPITQDSNCLLFQSNCESFLNLKFSKQKQCFDVSFLESF